MIKFARMDGGLPLYSSPFKRPLCWVLKHRPEPYEFGHMYPSEFCRRCGKQIGPGPTPDEMDWFWFRYFVTRGKTWTWLFKAGGIYSICAWLLMLGLSALLWWIAWRMA